MKCLSVRQPWASLLVSGIKDIENRSWDTPYRGKLLIHASSRKYSEKDLYRIPYELRNALQNGITTGTYPLDEVPYSAIIGYVTLADCIEGHDSIWAEDGCYNWVLKDAYIFDTPILGIKGKLNLYDVPELDENNLPPAHKAEPYGISRHGTELTIKTQNFLYEVMSDYQRCVFVYPTPELFKTLGTGEKENWQPGDIRTIRFITPDGDKIHTISHINYLEDGLRTDDGALVLDVDLLGNEFIGHVIQFDLM